MIIILLLLLTIFQKTAFMHACTSATLLQLWQLRQSLISGFLSRPYEQLTVWMQELALSTPTTRLMQLLHLEALSSLDLEKIQVGWFLLWSWWNLEKVKAVALLHIHAYVVVQFYSWLCLKFFLKSVENEIKI